MAPACFAARATTERFARESLISGIIGLHKTTARIPLLVRRAIASNRKARPGSIGFELPRQPLVCGRHRDEDVKRVLLGDDFQQVDIAGEQVGFRGDAQGTPALSCENRQDIPRDLKSAFGGLVRIRCSSQADALARRNAAKFAPKVLGIEGLDKDLAFELLRIPKFHELVRVSRVTVLATELAPAIRVDCPIEWHLTPTGAADEAAGRDLAIFHASLRCEWRTLGCEFGDADQVVRWGKLREQHGSIFAFYSPRVKRRIRFFFAFV